MCRVIIAGNQKGGVAKTTTVANLGIGLARHGKRVLLIDGDAQGSLTASLGHPRPDEIDYSLATVLGKIINEEEFAPFEGILRHPEGVSLLPGNIELSGVENSLVNIMSREFIMREYVESSHRCSAFETLGVVREKGVNVGDFNNNAKTHTLNLKILAVSDSIMVENKKVR